MPKQLQLAFRAVCEESRHPEEVPRLRGSLQIEALAMALEISEPLVARAAVSARSIQAPLLFATDRLWTVPQGPRHSKREVARSHA